MKDMGTTVPANPTSLPKPSGGGGSIGKDLKGLQQNIAKENAIGQAAGTIAGATLAPTHTLILAAELLMIGAGFTTTVPIALVPEHPLFVCVTVQK
jgi:hypothetical protein